MANLIKNERQYHITKSQAEKFEKAIHEMENVQESNMHPVLRKAQSDAMKSQVEDLQREIEEYESLRSGKRRVVTLGSLEEISNALIQARIAAGLTQEDLAAKLGVKPQQIQRYEATDYRSASLEKVNQIVRILGVKLRRPAEVKVNV